MKFISWNVNGLRAAVGKGFEDTFTDFNADFVCLQETKLQPGKLALEFPGYSSFWNYAEKKGYSGTCIFTRQTPLTVTNGIGVSEFDVEGRAITLEMPAFYLVNIYAPTSQDGLQRLGYRMRWETAFRSYICGLLEKKPVIICGDYNVAHKEIDLATPRLCRYCAGFSDEERAKFTELLSCGFTDSWRAQHPDEVQYTWWSNRPGARELNIGWRLDYFLVSNALMELVNGTSILEDVLGSDHCPIGLDLVFK